MEKAMARTGHRLPGMTVKTLQRWEREDRLVPAARTASNWRRHAERQLRERQLRESQLRESQLHESQLHESQLHESQLRESQLRESQLRESQLRGFPRLAPAEPCRVAAYCRVSGRARCAPRSTLPADANMEQLPRVMPDAMSHARAASRTLFLLDPLLALDARLHRWRREQPRLGNVAPA
jgi:DNA-binding transcriptional MerR regulator